MMIKSLLFMIHVMLLEHRNMGDIIGSQFTLPRDIIKATTNNFYDMEEETN